jgi:hypothetical protein
MKAIFRLASVVVITAVALTAHAQRRSVSARRFPRPAPSQISAEPAARLPASSHANEKGGVLGRKLVLVVEDDGSNGEAAARIYES